MNDRRREIERYKRKHRRVSFQENPRFFLNDLGNKIVSAIEQVAGIVIKTTKECFIVIKDFTNTIQAMPEDEYIKLLKDLESELTVEQMETLKRIRGGANGRKTDKA